MLATLGGPAAAAATANGTEKKRIIMVRVDVAVIVEPFAIGELRMLQLVIECKTGHRRALITVSG